MGRGKFVLGGGIRQLSIDLTYQKNMALWYGCSISAAEWLNLSAMHIAQLAHTADEGILYTLSRLLWGGLVYVNY